MAPVRRAKKTASEEPAKPAKSKPTISKSRSTPRRTSTRKVPTKKDASIDSGASTVGSRTTPKRAARTPKTSTTSAAPRKTTKATPKAATAAKLTASAKSTKKTATQKKKATPKKPVTPKKTAAPKTTAARKKTAAPKKTVAPKKTTTPKKSVVPKTTATPKKATKAKLKAAASTKSTASAKSTKSAAQKKITKAEPKAVATKATKAKPKAATATKSTKTATGKMPARKRKADEDDETTVAAPPTVAKRAKIAPTPKIAKKNPVINKVPTQVLQCFVFGEGSSGELGLGTRNRDKDVTRPRVNPNLSPEALGIVHIATGGMHTLALTRDNKIITWGVNDQGALGRNTEWSGGLRDADAEESDSDEDGPDADSGMNPLETTPTAISSDTFPPNTVFTQLAAGDSCSFALTDDGQVWGWGTFRSDVGVLGFTPDIHIQNTPMLMPTLHNIVKLACGQNHAVALDSKGSVFAWGHGQQAQIGRKILERHVLAGLIPGEFGLPKKHIKDISTGQNHAFAIDDKDRVWAWGLNSYGQTGIPAGAGEDSAFVSTPTEVKVLSGRSIKTVLGGGLHSMAIDAEGNCLTWGRADNNQLGIPQSDMAEEDVKLSPTTGKPGLLMKPTIVKAIPDPVAYVAAGVDTCFAITTKGKAYSWGFAVNYQTGLGKLEDAVEPTLIDNTAVKEKELVSAHAGGQFGILTAAAPTS